MSGGQEEAKPFWLRNIILFLSSQSISLLGSSIVQYAIMWHITLSTSSGFMMTLYIICGFVPTFLLSPFAGVWADRFDRRKLIMISDGVIALSTVILVILFMNGYDDIWFLFIVAAIRALGSAIQSPAVGAILPQIVPQDNLTSVNGVNGSIQGVISFASPIISAALLSAFPLEQVFLVDVVTAFVAIVVLVFLKISTHKKATESQDASYLSDFMLGVRYVNQSGFLKTFFAYFAVFFAFMSPAAFLTPLQVTRQFGEEVWRLSAIEIAFSVGMILGGGVIAVWKGFDNRIKTIALGCAVSSLCTIGLGAFDAFWVYLVCMAIFGLAMPFFNTPAMVLIQENVEESYLGRVFGVLGMISTSMMPLGMLVFGPLADLIPLEWILVTTGVLMLVLSYNITRNQKLLEVGQVVGGD